MTLAIFLLILGGMIVLFLTDYLPIDLTALAGLILLLLAGYVKPEEAFAGFSSPAVVLMLSTFGLSGALRLTGVAEGLSHRVVRISKRSETKTIAVVMILGAALSALMNNVAAVAVLLPTVSGISARTKISPSRLFIPLSFGVLLGATTTLMTSPNILAAEILRAKGFEPFHFLSFTPIGILLVVFGIIAVVFIGRHFLPGAAGLTGNPQDDLSELYRLKERMFSLRIPNDSRIHRQSLRDLHFGKTLGAEVLAIKRGGKTILAPDPAAIVEAGDLLIVRGRLNELQALLRLHGVHVSEYQGVNALPIEGARFTVTRSLLAGGITLKDLNFRSRYQVFVLGIERGEEIIRQNIPGTRLEDGDVLRVIGSKEGIESLSQNEESTEIVDRFPVDAMLAEGVFIAEIPSPSPLDQVRIRDSRLGELVSLTVIGIVRGPETILCMSGDERILAGDSLLIAGEADQARRLAALSEMAIESDSVQSEFESPEIGMMEVVLSPRSKLIGRTIEDLHFRERYGFRVLAIWRDGEPKRARFAKTPLQFGDALLLQGPRSRMHLFAKDSDFVVLSEALLTPRRGDQAIWAMIGFFILVVLSVFRIEPPHIAAAISLVVVVLAGAIRMEEIYREVEWRVVLLVAALLPLGMAVERVGLASLVSAYLSNLQLGPRGLVLMFCIISSILSQILDSSITVVLLGPIAISSAIGMNVSPRLVMLSVAIGASIAFLTPFSSRAHLLIMGPGGYRAADFWRIGLLITLVSIAVVGIFMPLVFPY